MSRVWLQNYHIVSWQPGNYTSDADFPYAVDTGDFDYDENCG